MQHQVEQNDLRYILERGHQPIGWEPLLHADDGRPHFNTTRFILDKHTAISVFHVKPVYYETVTGHWRPLSEITKHHGNRKIVLNEHWRNASIRFIDWLTKRQALFGQELLLPTPFGDYHIQEIARPVVSIGLATTTVYPDPDTETATVDGYIGHGDDPDWDTVHDGNDIYIDLNDDNTNLYAYVFTQGSGDNQLYKVLSYFDTSSIGASDTISSATASYYLTVKETIGNPSADFVSLVQVQGNNITSDTALTNADWLEVGDAIDSVTEGTDTGDRLDLGSASTDAYFDFDLNATGQGWVARSGEAKPSGATNGITYLGLRNGFDVADIDPNTSGPNFGGRFASADNTGTSQDPKLAVVHTAGASSSIKTIAGIAQTDIKTVAGITEANLKSAAGISNV